MGFKKTIPNPYQSGDLADAYWGKLEYSNNYITGRAEIGLGVWATIEDKNAGVAPITLVRDVIEGDDYVTVFLNGGGKEKDQSPMKSYYAWKKTQEGFSNVVDVI